MGSGQTRHWSGGRPRVPCAKRHIFLRDRREPWLTTESQRHREVLNWLLSVPLRLSGDSWIVCRPVGQL